MTGSGFGIRDSGSGIRDLGIDTCIWRSLTKRCKTKLGVFTRRIAPSMAVFTLILVHGCSSKTDVKPITLLPESNEVAGWSKTGETRTFDTSNLWEYIDGDAERYLRAGFEKTLTADYRYQGKIEVAADIYIMKSPEGARKVFESESPAGSQPIKLGDDARLFPASLSFRTGRYFIRLVAYQEAPESSKVLSELAGAIERNLTKAGARQ